jgi:hypothetical protein
MCLVVLVNSAAPVWRDIGESRRLLPVLRC